MSNDTARNPGPESADTAVDRDDEIERDSAGVYFVPVDVFEWRPAPEPPPDRTAGDDDDSG